MPALCHGSLPVRQASLHLDLLLGGLLDPGPFPPLVLPAEGEKERWEEREEERRRQGWKKENKRKGRREYEYISNDTMLLSVILTSIGNSSLALFSVSFALLDRSKKYLNREREADKTK